METYNGFVVGKKYNHIDASVICYFCGLNIQGHPIFEIVSEKDGCGISYNSDQISSKWVSKGSNKYWGYRGFEQEFDPNPIEDKEEKEMTIEEIQEECKKRFPIGCTFINTAGQEHVLVQDRVVYSIHGNDIWASDSLGLLYSNSKRKYAELVSLPGKQELTSLPEKWYVCPETEENLAVLKKYFKDFHDFKITRSNNAYTYDGKYHTHDLELTHLTKITFEQFKKWVLPKEKEEKYVPQVGDWVVILRDNTDTLVGKNVVGKLVSLNSFRVLYDPKLIFGNKISGRIKDDPDFPQGADYAYCYTYRDPKIHALRKALPHEISQIMKKGLNGRWLKALKLNPEGIGLKVGEYAQIKCEGIFYSINGIEGLGYSPFRIGEVWELMPEGFDPTKVTSESSSIFPDELIKEAEHRYPKGTVFKSAFSGGQHTSDGIMVQGSNNLICTDGGSFAVYNGDTKRWAEIVSRPAFDKEQITKQIDTINSEISGLKPKTNWWEVEENKLNIDLGKLKITPAMKKDYEGEAYWGTSFVEPKASPASRFPAILTLEDSDGTINPNVNRVTSIKTNLVETI